MNDLFKEVKVFKKINNECLILYRCYELLSKNKYCVQSKDYFYSPFTEEQINNSNLQKLELFFETLPNERSELYSSISDAIKAYDLEFED